MGLFSIFQSVGNVVGDVARGGLDVVTGNFAGAASQAGNVVGDVKDAVSSTSPDTQAALAAAQQQIANASTTFVNGVRSAAADTAAKAGIGVAGAIGPQGNWYEYVVEHPSLPIFVGLGALALVYMFARRSK